MKTNKKAKKQRSKKPKFLRQEFHKRKKLDDSWRRPRGLQSKMRRRFKGRGAIPCSGYGSPKSEKGIHPSGYEDVLIHTISDLNDIDPETQAIRIARGVGSKKKELIIEKAAEMGIRIINP
ncbi:MAG: 50S ribosomal protein L32e [Candidatus Hydrothermarchaeota archaeon]